MHLSGRSTRITVHACTSSQAMHTIAITVIRVTAYQTKVHNNYQKHSLSKVLSVCSSLHIPCPTSDTALTLTLYSVPASSPVRMVEVAGGETEWEVALLQEGVPCFLYCTQYREMVQSLWGVFQVTIRDGTPDVIVLFKETLTLAGPVREIVE